MEELQYRTGGRGFPNYYKHDPWLHRKQKENGTKQTSKRSLLIDDVPGNLKS